MSSTERFVTRREAAELCGCSVDSIRRRQNDDDFPNARLEDGTWMIPVSDLVAAGHLDPTAPSPTVPDSEHLAVPAPDGAETDALRIAHLEAELSRATAEIEFQRELLLQITAKVPEAA